MHLIGYTQSVELTQKVHFHTLNINIEMTAFFKINILNSLLHATILLSANNNTARDDSAWLRFGTLQFTVRESCPRGEEVAQIKQGGQKWILYSVNTLGPFIGSARGRVLCSLSTFRAQGWAF